jgi:uncharacterized membrane protein YeaQ/YmgE (transglycosylase-associated protein family)
MSFQLIASCAVPVHQRVCASALLVLIPALSFDILCPTGKKEANMKLFQWIWAAIVGFVIGLIARALLPGADHLGLLATTIVGILGSFVGGYVGALIKKPAEGVKFHPAGFIMSVVGAVLLLLVWRMIA